MTSLSSNNKGLWMRTFQQQRHCTLLYFSFNKVHEIIQKIQNIIYKLLDEEQKNGALNKRILISSNKQNQKKQKKNKRVLKGYKKLLEKHKNICVHVCGILGKPFGCHCTDDKYTKLFKIQNKNTLIAGELSGLSMLLRVSPSSRFTGFPLYSKTCLVG